MKNWMMGNVMFEERRLYSGGQEKGRKFISRVASITGHHAYE